MTCPYKALRETVIVADDRGKSQLDSGLYIPDSAKRVMGSAGEVVAIGEGIKEAMVGQYVVYRKYKSKVIEEDNGDRYAVVKEADILAILDPEGIDRIDVHGFKTNDLDVWKSDLAMENRRRMQREAKEKGLRMREAMIASGLDGR